MLEKLKEKKGGGTIFPIILMLIVSTSFFATIFILNLDNFLKDMQKDRYTKAVDMAVNTAVANIELSNDNNVQGATSASDSMKSNQADIGLYDEASNLEYLALGYDNEKRLVVNKEALMDTFYQVLLRNFQVKGLDKIENFQRYIPLKALLQYDTISVSVGMTYDATKKKYVDIWQDTRLGFKEAGTDIYMTLGDKCYTLKNPNETIEKRYLEANRNYFSVMGTNDYNITLARKNSELAQEVEHVLNAYANNQKTNENIKYQINIADFDYVLNRDTEMSNRIQTSINAAKDVTFFCLVEGLPMKSLFSNDPDYSFYNFSYGGASLKRVDQ